MVLAADKRAKICLILRSCCALIPFGESSVKAVAALYDENF